MNAHVTDLNQTNHATAIGATVLEKEGFDVWYQHQVDCFLKQHRSSDHLCKTYYSFKERCQRAKAQLEMQADLLTYNTLYAANHFAALSYILAQLTTATAAKPSVKLKIFDYGCGQGLATLALLSHLEDRTGDIELHLVEPSSLALEAAAHYVAAFSRRCLSKISIHTHCVSLDALPDGLFTLDAGQSAVHLFSNVLDMDAYNPFNLNQLFDQIRLMRGTHLIIGVSPVFTHSAQGFTKLRQAFPYASTRFDQPTFTFPCRFFSLKQGKMTEKVIERQGLVLQMRHL